MKKKTLVVMAAGMGSRFAGGVKQLQPVGPGGEVLMEYSICDALEAGFNRIVFIIRHDIEELFEENIGCRIRPACEKRNVEVVLAYQEKENLPGGMVSPQTREKPWGTGHALLACRDCLQEGFAVINADDYYGKDAYEKASAFLDTLQPGQENIYGLVGFSLGNTLSEHGGVTRGLCQVSPEGWLTGIAETKNIVKAPRGARAGEQELAPEVPVSMNMWVFTPDVLTHFDRRFREFLGQNLQHPTAEFLIPIEIGAMLQQGNIQVRVLPTNSSWIGMTYIEDLQTVREAFARMDREGLYSQPLLG